MAALFFANIFEYLA